MKARLRETGHSKTEGFVSWICWKRRWMKEEEEKRQPYRRRDPEPVPGNQ